MKTLSQIYGLCPSLSQQFRRTRLKTTVTAIASYDEARQSRRRFMIRETKIGCRRLVQRSHPFLAAEEPRCKNSPALLPD